VGEELRKKCGTVQELRECSTVPEVCLSPKTSNLVRSHDIVFWSTVNIDQVRFSFREFILEICSATGSRIDIIA
jgi:hypothetical protein